MKPRTTKPKELRDRLAKMQTLVERRVGEKHHARSPESMLTLLSARIAIVDQRISAIDEARNA